MVSQVRDRIRIVLVTAPKSKAEILAKKLVEKRLAACVSVVPGLQSHYRWKGHLHKDREALLVIKTTQGLWKALVSFIESNHPYEIPEILSLPVLEGYKPYVKWLLSSCA